MAFPSDLDNLYNTQRYIDGTTVIQAAELNKIQQAVDALEAKVGVNNSIVTTSHDYLFTNKQVFPYMAVGTTDLACPATESDMPDMTLTITTKGTKLLCLAQASMGAQVEGSSARIYLYIDGVNKRSSSASIDAWGDSWSLMHVETGLTPGSHNIKLRWDGQAGIITQPGTTSQRILIVLDIP